MSSWPLITDFSRMLQTPQAAFRSPELKQCRVEMNQLGQPKARSGNFATVYRAFAADNSEFALRIFNRRQDERLEHYRIVSEYLESRGLSSIVGFEYDDRGIRSAGDGKLYPLLTMDWVPGVTLFEWTRDRCRENYAEALKIAADVWLHLVRELADNNIVHGDLQQGNVLVSQEGHFKLVDYDCMCVPALVGRRNLEIGMTPYQHPGRNADTVLFPGLDNYSSLVIYVALRALAAAPHLWITYVDQPEYDRILFRAEDFQNPAASPLYRDLMNSPDEQVRDLTHYLFELYKYDLHSIPPVDEVLLWCESVESLVSAQDWDKVVQLVERMGPGEQVAPEMQPFVQEAQRRSSCRQAAEEAFAQGNEERLEQLYATGLLSHYPAAAHLSQYAASAGQVRQILPMLEQARQTQNWGQFRQTWQTYQQYLQDRPSTQVYQQEMQKLATVERLRELLASPQSDMKAINEAWEYLKKLGGHPLAAPFLKEIEHRLVRQRGLAQLQELLLQAPPAPTLAHDKKMAAACPPAVIQGMDPNSPLAQQYRTAQKRLQLVKKVHEVEKSGTLEGESLIAGVLTKLPETYHEGLTRRSQQAQRRIYAYNELAKLLQEKPISEAQVAQAWEKLGQLKGRILVPEKAQARCELAVARTPLLRQLQQIPRDIDRLEFERQVLELWKPDLLDQCAQASPWRRVRRQAVLAQQTIEALQKSVEAEDLPEVERLLNEPCMQDRPLVDELQQNIENLRAQAKQAMLARRQALVTALLENGRNTFHELFDADLVREICRQSPHHQPLVNQWMDSEILPVSRSGLAVDAEQAIQRDENSGMIRFSWTWPATRISTRCRLLISKRKPAETDIPDDIDALLAIDLEHAQWSDEVGCQVEFQAEWEQAYVSVWAVIDLEFQTFYTLPLEIGRIQPAEKQKRWSFFRRSKGETVETAVEENTELETVEAPPQTEEAPPANEAEEAAPAKRRWGFFGSRSKEKPEETAATQETEEAPPEEATETPPDPE